MITLLREDEYETALAMQNLFPDECERNDDEYVAYAVIQDAIDRYEERYYPIVEREVEE